MMAEKTPDFNTADDEIKYWKEQALMYQKGMLEAREELEEFQVRCVFGWPFISRFGGPDERSTCRSPQGRPIASCQNERTPSRLLFLTQLVVVQRTTTFAPLILQIIWLGE
jgi:hypothetical protein